MTVMAVKKSSHTSSVQAKKVVPSTRASVVANRVLTAPIVASSPVASSSGSIISFDSPIPKPNRYNVPADFRIEDVDMDALEQEVEEALKEIKLIAKLNSLPLPQSI